MRKVHIPFNRVDIQGNEFEYIHKAISSAHISGDGIFTHKCNSLLEKELGVKKSLLTTSCTHALEMSAILLDIKSGDEVIVPSFTFVSTVNAFVLRGEKYRIGYAESDDGQTFTRMDEEVGIGVSQDGWDSDMICYPCVFDLHDMRYMIYCGNEYGKTVFGLAILDSD